MKEWPTWMPTASIMERWPAFQAYIAHGPLQGQWDNPLGARALYLYQGNHDTLYRIHGTNEPSEIGQAVSSGCIRMRDMDAIDLYNRVHVGTPVLVIIGRGLTDARNPSRIDANSTKAGCGPRAKIGSSGASSGRYVCGEAGVSP